MSGVSDVECPVLVVLSEAEVEEVSNSVDRVVSGVPDVECPVSVVLSKAEVEVVSTSVDRVVFGVSDSDERFDLLVECVKKLLDCIKMMQFKCSLKNCFT